MKYRLKKDLPFAKAGLEVIITIDEDFDFMLTASLQPNQVLFRTSKKNIEKLIEWGWIEEIKPREWTVTEWEGNIYNKVQLHSQLMKGTKDIKVREVLE